MMTEFLQTYLPICVFVLLIILLVIGIILGVRLIKAMDKLDIILDNVDRKVNSLNGIFNVIDFTTDKISQFSDRVVEGIFGLISRFGRKKRTSKIDDNEEDDYE